MLVAIKYQNMEKPLKHQRGLGLGISETSNLNYLSNAGQRPVQTGRTDGFISQ